MIKNRVNLVSSAMLALILAFFQVSEAQTPAFPGVEGFGQNTRGGRGGRVIEVTNLNDNGPGSLRQAVQVESGPRIVVFRVGGSIALDSAIRVLNPYLTIAGQTAPGGGVLLKNYGLYINHSEVIVRHIRVRNKDTVNDWGIGIWNDYSVADMQNIVLDHVSVSWAEDENICAWGQLKNVTVQWSITSEGTSGISCGNHATDISIHHNLFAHMYRRNPAPNQSVDAVNNVIYSPGYASTGICPVYEPVFFNLVNNYYKEGYSTLHPSDGTAASTAEIWVLGYKDAWPNAHGTDEANALASRLYISGNKVRLWNTTTDTEARILRETRAYVALGSTEMIPNYTITIPEISARHSFPQVTTTSAEQAYIDVLAGAGATLPARDAVDTRILSDVQNSTGTRDWPFNRTWPTLALGTPPTDSDHDGMPNTWESSNGLNPNSDADGPLDNDGDGYTNVEEYLNELAGNNTNTAISPVRPGAVSKSMVFQRAKQGVPDIFGRTIGEKVKSSKKQLLTHKIMQRKLGQEH